MTRVFPNHWSKPRFCHMPFTPIPFNLPVDGNPFEYSTHALSSISGTEAFETGIKTRDSDKCIVCGFSKRRGLNYCHIIPKKEDDTVRYALLFYRIRKLIIVQWEIMKENGFVPEQAKGV